MIMKTIIIEIEREMIDVLDDLEMNKLHKVLIKALEKLDVNENKYNKNSLDEIINYCEIKSINLNLNL